MFLGLLLASCTVGPNYTRPDVETPAAYKEAGDWLVARPKDEVPRGPWWTIFGDPAMDELMAQVDVSNQTLKAAEARYAAARASTRGARSALFPTLGASADASRARRGGGQGAASSYTIALDASWEPDLWGRVRRRVEAARAAEEASAGDVEAARLSLQAQLATSYIQLRVTDAQMQLLEASIKAFQTSLDIARNRYRAGVAAKADVVQAEAQLKSIEAQAIDLESTRAQLEHAVAVLVGRAPAALTVAPLISPLDIKLPEIPPGVPSTLLERRPDIAAAERRMAAANAQIGVVQAAYYPNLSLTASLGFAGASLGHLVSAPNRFWSLGAGLADTLLDFGARSAQVDVARAGYDEQVANYRDTVLGAFRDVENNLAALHWLQEELAVQREAVRLARESVQLALNQYKAGTIAFLNVVQLQTAQLSEERTYVNLVGRRAAASVALVLALGGGWEQTH